jgi:hypothetical protein
LSLRGIKTPTSLRAVGDLLGIAVAGLEPVVVLDGTQIPQVAVFTANAENQVRTVPYRDVRAVAVHALLAGIASECHVEASLDAIGDMHIFPFGVKFPSSIMSRSSASVIIVAVM